MTLFSICIVNSLGASAPIMAKASEELISLVDVKSRLIAVEIVL